MTPTSKKSFARGLSWYFMCLGVGIANDAVTKVLISGYKVQQIVFFRFVFSFITLLPLVFKFKLRFNDYKSLVFNFLRGVILYVATMLWSSSFEMIPLSTVTTIGFAMPIFVLLLSFLFLKERVTIQRVVLTILGFTGVWITYSPQSTNDLITLSGLLGACCLFALLDVINKMRVDEESLFSMVFFSGMFAAGMSCIFQGNIFQSLFVFTKLEILLFLLLGLGSNLLLLFLLKAFKYAEATALSPFRYVEICFSIALGYLIFNETPSLYTMLGSLIIIFSTYCLWYLEKESSRVQVIRE